MDREIKNLAEAMGLTPKSFERKKVLLEIAEKDLLEIRFIGSPLLAKVEEIVKELQQYLLAIPEVQEIAKDYDLEVFRQKAKEYLEELFGANYDYDHCLKLAEAGTYYYQAGIPHHLIPIGYRKLSSIIISILPEIVPKELCLPIKISLEKIFFLELIVIMHAYFYAEEQKLRETMVRLERLNHTHELVKDLHKHIIRAEDLHNLIQGTLKIFTDGCPNLEAIAICTISPEGSPYVVAMNIRNNKNQEFFRKAFCELAQIGLEHRAVLSLHFTEDEKKLPLISKIKKVYGINYALSFPISVWDKIKGTLCLLSSVPLNLSQLEVDLLAETVNDLGLVWVYLESKRELEEFHLKDHLTGLPKRDLFTKGLDIILKAEENVCLVIADISDFWAINHEYGYGIGDALLQKVSQRIKELPHPLLRGRIGADDFTLVLPMGKEGTPTKYLEELRRTLEKPYRIQEHQVSPSFTLGCALSPYDGTEADDLLNKAELARQKAKEGKGVEGVAFYSPELLEDIRRYRELEQEIQKALEAEEFEIFLQPRIEVKFRRISGAEALIRWNHPRKGLIPPYQFIPFLEESGWIQEVGFWILSQTCQIINQLRLLDHNIRVSCNVSVIQLRQSDFKENLLKITKEHDLEPEDLYLEITESALAEPEILQAISDLKSEGFHWEIDDFGTGYSSLLYLKKIPASVLKVDHSFVRGLPDSKEDAEIVKLILSLAQSLNFTTVAEGVEHFEQLVFLTGLGVQEAQGYHFAKPMPIEEFIAYVNSYNPSDYFWTKKS